MPSPLLATVPAPDRTSWLTKISNIKMMKA